MYRTLTVIYYSIAAQKSNRQHVGPNAGLSRDAARVASGMCLPLFCPRFRHFDDGAVSDARRRCHRIPRPQNESN